MGTGNQKLKSFDNELFEPKTYFLDLGEDPEEDEEQDYEQERANYEDLIDSICSELELEEVQEERHDDLCSTFRESGVIIAEGKHSYVITETGSEYRNLPIAVIPNFKLEDIEEEVENPDSELSYDEIHEEAKKQWRERFPSFEEEAKKILKKLKEWYGDNMTTRNGSWLRSKTSEEPTP